MEVNMANKLTWHGHANFQITTPNISIIIDPWFEGNPSAQSSSKDIANPDLVLVTHDHDDHTGQAVEICQQTGAHVLAVVETAQKLAQQGVPENQVVNGIGANIGGTIDFKGTKITMVQAEHSSLSGTPVGFIITLEDGYCLYHAGDTGIFSSMELFGQLYNIDLAILPTGGIFTMDPRQAALACRLLKCKAVVPMHWGSFPILEQNTKNFEKELDRINPDISLFAMNPGEEIELPGKTG
jgi:L-ascorbate metabolism protein UlaG (beta-lactamase superfamily)